MRRQRRSLRRQVPTPDPRQNGQAGPPLAPVLASAPTADPKVAATEFEPWLRRELPRIPKLGVYPLPYVLAKIGCGHPPTGTLSEDTLSEGLVMEFGVWSGATINQIAEACGAEQPVYGFDSFEGLPEDFVVDNGTTTGRVFVIPSGKGGNFDLGGVPPPVASNVQLVKGWFSATLPGFLALPEVAAPNVSVSLLHVDSDLYSSAHYVLESLDAKIRPGSVIVFDELVNFPHFRQGELKALYEWAQTHRRRFEWLGVAGAVTLDGMNPEGEGPWCSVGIRVTV